ncbi:MAG: PH domain-containing protein, partial [Planctomycetota bacterium]
LASVVAFVVRYYGFHLRRHEDRITVSHGLFAAQEGSLSRRRIQSVKLEEGVLRRWLGRASVRVDNAGDREEVDDNKKRNVLLPVAPVRLAIQLVCELVEGLDDLHFTPLGAERTDSDPKSRLDWQRLSPLAIQRGSRKGWLVAMLALIQLSWAFGWYSLCILPAFPAIYLLNRQWFRYTGFCVGERHFLLSRGWVNRSTLCLPLENIQNVTVFQSPFDRRLNLATLSIDTAGQSNTGGGPVIRNLPLRTALGLRHRLAAHAACSEFVW